MGKRHMEKRKLYDHFIEVQGHSIHYLSNTNERDVDTESTRPLLVFLHGFPENAHAWEGLIAHLPKRFDVVAPDLPGYYKSEPLSSIEDYSVPMLLTRIAAFVELVGRKRQVVLVGHDWGGAIAWPLAAFHSQLFSKLIIMNAAHPSTFTSLLKTSRTQRLKSQYIQQLIADDAHETLVQSDFSLLRNMLGDALFSSDKRYADTLLSGWKNSDSLRAMLNYYKNMPQAIPFTDADDNELAALRVPNIRIVIPTLVLWGKNDDAFDVSILDGLPNYVEELTVHQHNDATHWIHREQAQWAADHINKFVV